MPVREEKYLLDFEKPVARLEEKLEDMRAMQGTRPELARDVAELDARIQALQKSIYENLTHWQRVQIARHPLRPYTSDYISALTDGFIELHGDRCYGDDPAVIGGFASLLGQQFDYRDRTVLILGHQKGRDLKSRKFRRFGMPNPEGYRKARRLMQLAAKFNKPVICLLDTPGAYPGKEAEERGQAEAIARNLFAMAELPVPVVIVIIGEGASGGALGIGVGDRMLMMENAWYSVIAPESCSSILWRSWRYKEEAARALKLTAPDLVSVGIIDQIIPEPTGGAHHDPEHAYQQVGQAICDALKELDHLAPEELLDQRLHRLNQVGRFDTVA
ncbi:MAG: acetyl-CoA carboxylase carboxyltransferase subunit alpha [Bacteroidota bacterium]|nr:acetyl-CoA carboxylase carboxyltransferase subunit alpha [Bacteroidota bacterium]MDE2835362.1 acetyl-CoA carboxylase carboxyltransferase subunit alpha [Bacteroidota bacterium]MDE2958008.1 acetyl-CoA carboxylase carboxyltransferase subunit alpha [Bacteroidota bacterium]